MNAFVLGNNLGEFFLFTVQLLYNYVSSDQMSCTTCHKNANSKKPRFPHRHYIKTV